MDARRVERLSEQFRMLISGILEKDISDPRLEFVSVNRVTLLPYHEMGRGKSRAASGADSETASQASCIEVPSAARMAELAGIFQAKGVVVGGGRAEVV